MALRITIENASSQELQRGVDAARDFFAAIKLDPKEAARAAFAREGWAMAGYPDGGLSDATSKAADAWSEADRVAVEAACATWPVKPSTADLSLAGS